MEKDNKIIERIQSAIDKVENNDFTVFFFTLDSKGTPSGSIGYVYDFALTLQKLGYKVCILHQEKEFVGPYEWLGQEYESLQHENVEDGNIVIGPQDFLILPEIFALAMAQTKKLPCKRIALLQNYNYLTEFIPLGTELATFGIKDVIVNSKNQDELIKSVFKYAETVMLPPKIQPYFRKGIDPKKLIVNIVTKKAEDVNRIVKPFYWKYPIFKWVSFRDLRGYPKETFAEYLREGAITVWVDDDTQFGYAPLEAIHSGNIVVAKTPNMLPEWAYDKENDILDDSIIWVTDINDIHKMIYGVVSAWISDSIPDEIYEAMDAISKRYTADAFNANVGEVMSHYKAMRKAELQEVLEMAKNAESVMDMTSKKLTEDKRKGEKENA